MNGPELESTTPLGDGCMAAASRRPGTVEELRALVRDTAGDGEALYAQGGRQSLDYGGTPARAGLALDLTGLDQVIEYPYDDMTITVGAGMTLGRLQAVLSEHGQRLPLDPPLAASATLGGIVATAWYGPRRYGLGRPRDLAIGMRFLLADGREIAGGGRVAKNVAGYDFPRLITGSLGTLGIITQLTLVVRPRPEASGFLCCGLDDLAGVAAALDRLHTTAARPVAIELMNRSGGPAGGPLAAVDAPWRLIIGTEGRSDVIAWELGRMAEELAPARSQRIEGQAAEPLWTELSDLPETRPGLLSLRASVAPSRLPAWLEGLDASQWAVHAHAGNGVAQAHWLGGAMDEGVLQCVEAARQRAEAAGGSVVLTRCPVDLKARLKVWGQPRNDWPAMARIKQTLDPDDRLNPGRLPFATHDCPV